MVFRILLIAIFVTTSPFTYAQSFNINGFYPYQNMPNAPTEATILVSFDSPIEVPSNGRLLVYDENGRRIPGVKTVQTNQVTFVPYRELPAGQTITVAVLDFRSSVGSVPASPIIFSFKTLSYASPVSPPKVKAISIPDAGDQFAKCVQPVDFDGDGDIDIVSSTRWLENAGNQDFVIHELSTWPYFFDMKVFDLNGDGNMDVVGSTYGGVSWMKNDGNMNFDEVTITASGIATSISIGDINIDNLPDILIAVQDGSQSQGVSWLINNGDGSFSREVVTANAMGRAAVCEINVDYNRDVIASDDYNLYWYYNYGAGWTYRKILTAETEFLGRFSWGDIDNDHEMDIVVSEGSKVWLLQFEAGGDSRFEARTIDEHYSGGGLFSIGDFDGDGDQDIISNEGYSLIQYLNTGDGNFDKVEIVSFGEPVDEHVLFDNDLDGDLDIVYKLYYGQIGWTKNTTLADALPFESVFPDGLLPEQMGAAAWADVDLDNDQDLFVSGNFDGGWGWRIFENLGGGWHLRQQSTGSVISSCYWFDYDNDGDPDLVISGRSAPYSGSPLIQVHLNNNGFLEHLADPNLFPEGIGGEVAAADLNNDGKADLIVLGEKGGVYSRQPERFVKVADLGPMPFQNSRIALADVDLDGDLDLAMTGWLGNDDVGTLGTLAVNQGDFRFSRNESAFRGLTSGTLMFSDYDSDGDPDLAVLGTIRSGGSNLSSGSIYLNENGTFVPRVREPSEASIYVNYDGSGAFGDFTGDGYPDLVTHYGNYGSLNLMEGLNSGWFKEYPVSFKNIPYSANILKAVDVDMDNDLDFLCQRTLYRNNTSNVNQRPSPPVALLDSVRNNILYLYWTDGNDAETAVAGLSYRVYAGTQEGKQDLISALAKTESGAASVQGWGLSGKVRQLKFVSAAPVHWAVQSVDASYAGSLFSAPKISTPIYIEGEARSCTGTVQKYRAHPSGSYQWKVSGGVVISASQDEIEVVWTSEGSGTVQVGDGGQSNTLDITIVTKPEPVIAGPEQVCSASADNVYFTPEVDSHAYNWTVVGGEFLRTPNEAKVFVKWKDAGVGSIMVSEVSKDQICVVENELPIEIAATPALKITGPQLLCAGSTDVVYELEDPGDHSIQWSIFGGDITTDNTNKIAVRWFDQALGRVTVKGLSGACEGLDIMEISLLQVAAPDITGPFVVCNTSTATVYSVTDEAEYNHHWTIEGGSVVGSPTSASVQVKWVDTGTGRIFVTRKNQICERRDSAFVNVFPPIVPPEIDVLSANTLSATGGIAYQWYLDGDALEGETGKTINPVIAGEYSVLVTDVKGCTASSSGLPYPITTTEELIDQAITVYPVPVHDEFVIQISNGYRGPVNVQVCDMLGRTIQHSRFEKDAHSVSHQMILDGLPGSFLILDIRGDGFFLRRKIVLE